MESPFFMNETLRNYFIDKNQFYYATTDDKIIKDQYHTLFALPRHSTFLPHLCSLVHQNYTSHWISAQVVAQATNNNNSFLYKAIEQETGQMCVIRSDVIQIQKDSTNGIVHHLSEERLEQLKNLKHSHIVSLHHVSCIQTITPQKTTQLELFTVYDCIPQTISLEQLYVQPLPSTTQQMLQPIEESLLWSILVQLLSIVKYLVSTNTWQPHMVHSFHPSKLLIIPNLLPNKPKLYWNGLGWSDLFLYSSLQHRSIWQQFCIICCSLMMNMDLLSKLDIMNGMEDASELMENVFSNLEQKYSQELIQLLKEWFTIEESAEELTRESILQQSCKLVDKIEEERYFNEEWNNYLEDELTKELENGRLFRLLLKMQQANQKLDQQHSSSLGTNSIHSSTSSTGTTTTTSSGPHHLHHHHHHTSHPLDKQEDLTILKLFNRYLLHPTSSQSKIDIGHVVENLNKLDIGSEEKILLKDEQDLIVVKFSDLKKLLQ